MWLARAKRFEVWAAMAKPSEERDVLHRVFSWTSKVFLISLARKTIVSTGIRYTPRQSSSTGCRNCVVDVFLLWTCLYAADLFVRRWVICTSQRYLYVAELFLRRRGICPSLRYLYVAQVFVRRWGVCTSLRCLYVAEVFVCRWRIFVRRWRS